MSTCANETAPAEFAITTDIATHVANNVLVLMLLATVDRLVLTPAVETRLGSKQQRSSTALVRWFLIHSIANFFVCATALTSMRTVLADPHHAMDGAKYVDRSLWGAASAWPLTIINSVHLYHMLGGFKLTSADYFHHLLFIPTLGFPGQV